MPAYADIQSIRNFKSLVRYLRTRLDWPIDEESPVEDVAFDYEPDELGLDEHAAALREIRKKVERHIQNGYLKSVQAPAGVRAAPGTWMELG